jgi:uncharacterized protein with HEPN domain
MLEAMENIERYASQGKETFEQDELIQNGIVRHLQIVGEAARAMPQEIRGRAPHIPWSQMIGMRHILVHDYFRIDTVAQDCMGCRRTRPTGIEAGAARVA